MAPLPHAGSGVLKISSAMADSDGVDLGGGGARDFRWRALGIAIDDQTRRFAAQACLRRRIGAVRLLIFSLENGENSHVVPCFIRSVRQCACRRIGVTLAR
ncbi:hypothetical protein LP419_17820 [Massilia sp. H-1]|nr:hypothetical protein LP419_17820 [Massilia sp. H-1]